MNVAKYDVLRSVCQPVRLKFLRLPNAVTLYYAKCIFHRLTWIPTDADANISTYF